MARALSMERAPPQAVPLRFLLTAPWFAVAAGCVLLWGGPDAIASRWTGTVLAATHLLTLGFMAQAMLGALLQLLPVVAGVPVPRSETVAVVVHPALLLGTLGLAAGFLGGGAFWFPLAMFLLGAAFAVYLGALAAGFARQRLQEPSARVILVAVVALLVTVVLGLVLAAGLAGLRVPLLELTQLHAAWGILGWTLLLVLGAALAIVPMFQMTAAYPSWLRGRFAAALFTALVLWSTAAWFAWAPIRHAVEWWVALAVGAVAVSTLVLQQRGKRRRQPDSTFLFWRLGMLCLLASVAVWALGDVLRLQGSQRLALSLGVLLLPGFAVSVIAGMLYKIVPFLLWLTLQLRAGGRPPQVREILPDAKGHLQFWMHAAAIVLLFASITLWSGLVYPGAAALSVSAAMLGVNLLRAVHVARRYLERSAPLPAGSGRARWKTIA
jgi:hypothetical protein